MKSKRALIVCPEPPYPVRGGGALRTAALLEWLARRFTIDAVFFGDGESGPHIAERCVIHLPEHSKSAAARLSRNLDRAWRGAPPLNDRYGGFEADLASFADGRRWDVCVVEHFWCAPYAATFRPHANKLVLDLHNVESALYGRYSKSTPPPLSLLHRRFSDAASGLERQWLPRYDHVLAASEADRARIAHLVSSASVYPNTVRDRDVPALPKRNQVVFSGNMEYQPNREAVKWFAHGIWPDLAQRHTTLEWVLLGKNPQAVHPVVHHLPRVRQTGEVEDALPELAQSLIAVVPLLSGSGTRLKIIEAWMAGVPVVSTTIGAEGLPCRHGEHLLLADSPGAFLNAINQLISDSHLRARLSAAGRQLFREYFTWEAGWKVLDRLDI